MATFSPSPDSFQWIGTQFADPFGHGLGSHGECMPLAAGHEEHIQAFTAQTNLVEDLLGALDTRLTAFVAAYVVAVSNWAGDLVYAIRALFEGF